MPEKRFYWTWYWPQSVEAVARDGKGYPTQEEALKAGQAEELRLLRTWGPGKGFRLKIDLRIEEKP